MPLKVRGLRFFYSKQFIPFLLIKIIMLFHFNITGIFCQLKGKVLVLIKIPCADIYRTWDFNVIKLRSE